MKLVRKRINGEPWRGSLVPPDVYCDVENFFRPFRKPQYHKAPTENTPSAYPPALDTVGIDLLDANLRDMTGMRYADSHFLTHDAKNLTKAQTPCWTCQKAATRQLRKYSERSRVKQKKLEHRFANKVGDQITGDYAVITDLNGRGGVHGARNLYTQKDILTGKIDCVPTKKQDGKSTTIAMMHILGDLPRRDYFSDNQACLNNGARLCNMNPEESLVGVSQTNGIAEANNKTILSGGRKLLCHAGLPACWWTYATPCYCFTKNAMLDLNNESAYFDTCGSHFPGKLIPFGCMVHYIPPHTRDRREQNH